MAAIYLPAIAEKDYPPFLSLPGHDFPDTYDEWLKLIKEQARQYEIAGDDIIWVGIDPDEFVRACARDGSSHDLKSLYRLCYGKKPEGEKD